MTALRDKLLARADRADGCWAWRGTVNLDGYGTFALYPAGERGRKVTKMAHRLVYEEFVGQIPDGMTVDHRCHPSDGSCPGGRTCPHRRCVNPQHLRPTEFIKNVLRGVGPTAVNSRKTHCVHGHPFDEANTYIRPGSGNRDCKTCLYRRLAESNERKRLATPSRPRRVPQLPAQKVLPTHCPRGHDYAEGGTRHDAIGRRRCLACAPITSDLRQVTHCPKGHLKDEDNTYVSNGKRGCRECRRELTRRWRREQRLLKVAS